VSRVVAIDAFLESVERYPGHALAVFDVIRATTTAVTAVSRGLRVHPAASLEDAEALAGRLDEPLLVGEVGGEVPDGFDLGNSPAAVAELETSRPVVLLSTSGMPIVVAAGVGSYVGALRNYAALARHLAAGHERVALIGAGTRGEFREEDQLGCAWTAAVLLDHGFEPANDETLAIVERWRDADVEALTVSNSVGYLRRTEQLQDLDFVLSHVDDLDLVVTLGEGVLEVEPPLTGSSPRRAATPRA
jgi:2-phosphosulfolactate phosphatase